MGVWSVVEEDPLPNEQLDVILPQRYATIIE